MIHRMLVAVIFALAVGHGQQLCFAQTQTARYEASVVVLHVSKQEWDVDAPWSRKQVQRESYLATLVGDNLFLTTAEAVAAANFIEVQRYGASKKFVAEVLYRDYEANLAALRVKDKQLVSGMKAVALGADELPINERVVILHGREDRLFGRAADVRNVVTRPGNTSPYPFPAYELELNDGASFGFGEPVLSEGKLVGITTSRQNNVVYSLPGMAIRHFLNDKLTEDEYRGFPFIGTATHRLVSPHWRRYLGVSTNDGVRISEVFPTSPYYDDLKVDDVLVAADGIRIDARGNYDHKLWGKIFFSYLISKKYAGDEMSLEIIRDGKTLTFSRKLTRFDRNRSRIAYYRPDTMRIPHIIFGGLLFQELSRPYLMTWGNNWYAQAPDRLLFFWQNRNTPPEFPNERIIILNRVLADPYNQGHQELEDHVIESVNDKPVRSISDLEAALRQPVARFGGDFAVIRFKFGIPAIMLSYDGLAKAHQRIAKNYSIKAQGSFFKP